MREKVREELKRYTKNPDFVLELPILSEYFQSQPVELWAERECPVCKKWDNKSIWSGPCRGTGLIRRQLTMKEAADIPRMIIEGKADYYSWESSQAGPSGIHREILLPSGEKVRVK